MYTRSDDDILPAPRRRASGHARVSARRGRTVLAEVALTLGALLGLVVTGVTLMAAQTGLRPLVVRSGSMEPTIATGSMVLVRRIAADEIRKGDIVAVERPDHTRVTHRVLGIERHGRTAELTMKGDANEDADAVPVTVRRADRLVYQVPELGRVGAWLATPRGGFVVGCLLTAVFMQVVRRRAKGAPLAAHA